MRNAAKRMMYELAKKNKNIMILTADGHDVYQELTSENHAQFVDYGIAESNMVASAAGLAACGKIPFLFAVTNFMAMRAFEFIRDIVCIPNYNVKFIGYFSALSRGPWGETHYGTDDLAILRCIPNLVVITPATPIETREAVRFASKHQGPVYIRIEASNEPELYNDTYKFTLGKSTMLCDGNDVTIVSMGSILNVAVDVSKLLKKKNIGIRVIDMPTVRPIDKDALMKAMNESRGIIVLEEHNIYGGLGTSVAEVLLENKCQVPFIRMGIKENGKMCGTQTELREINHIAEVDVISNVKRLL